MNAHVMDEKAIGGSSVEGLVPAQNDARRWGLKAAGSAQKRPVEPISITRCFAMVGMLIVLAIGFASAIVLSLFVRDQMLQRDLELTAQFLRQSSIQKYANSYFLRDGDQAGTDSEVEKSFAEIESSNWSVLKMKQGTSGLVTS